MCAKLIEMRNSAVMFVTLVFLSTFFCKSQSVNAGDYVQDPAPKVFVISREGDPFDVPMDPEVCGLYLQNIRYFSRRGEPLSCEQPIAPMLKRKIQKIEWENLNPEQYPELLNDVVKQVKKFGEAEPSVAELTLSRDEIQKREYIFRRAKLNLKGYPKYRGQAYDRPIPESQFHIVQYGPDVTDPGNPSLQWRCEQLQGRRMKDAQRDSPQLFLATQDLRHIYNLLHDDTGASGQNIWLIKGFPYVERYSDNGDVQLAELRKELPVYLTPVCLYHFKNK